MNLLGSDDVGPAAAAPAWNNAEAPGAGAALRRTALNDWENEGGHISGRHKANQPVDNSATISSPIPAPVGLAAMRAKLNSDFANGLVGQRHNIFHHRTRVLAQLTKACRSG